MPHPTEQNSDSKPNSLAKALIDQKHFPSLDGLRGVSILLVIIYHLRLSWSLWYLKLFNGPLGVSIFFVISGFLITSLCLKEKIQTGDISLKNFYVRRILRILPVAYLYIAVVFVCDHIFHFNNAYFQYLAALFFVMNFSYFRKHGNTNQLGHYWSLSVEEQFYILFPVLLKKNYRIFFWSIVFIAAVLPLLCLLQEFVRTLNQGVFYYFTHYLIKFQSISIGCLLALFVFKFQFNYNWLHRFKTGGNIIAILLIFYLGYDEFYSIKAVFVNLAIATLIAYVIISNITPANDFIYQFLNSKVLSFIGKLSYSIYIWQQLFIYGVDKQPAFTRTLPGSLLLTIAVSLISYFAYERYFLRLKSKFKKQPPAL